MYVRGADLLEGKVVVTDDAGDNGGGALPESTLIGTPAE